jgi:hypothetical protein
LRLPYQPVVRIFKAEHVINLPNRDLLVLIRLEHLTEQAVMDEVQQINNLLRLTETSEKFCIAHELVDRNRITSRSRKILEAIREEELKPFRFLINKN